MEKANSYFPWTIISVEYLSSEHLCHKYKGKHTHKIKKETLLKVKTQLKHHILIVVDFNKALLPLDKTTRLNFNRETKEVTQVMCRLG